MQNEDVPGAEPAPIIGKPDAAEARLGESDVLNADLALLQGIADNTAKSLQVMRLVAFVVIGAAIAWLVLDIASMLKGGAE